MSRTRPISFATGGVHATDAPVTLFYREPDDRNYHACGLYHTPGLHAVITVALDAMCDTPGRTILRTDDGSGAAVSVEGLVHILATETKLGGGHLDSVYVTVYSSDPFAVAGPAAAALASPAGQAQRVAAGERISFNEKHGCCAMQ
ncbi:unnamed protein product [Zymoseptoria tritici ST99CH_3D1]|uniref:Uncharacterized protein n=3 Tax=Zymoseptoria tritici TaxID=1047171 RepID=F9XHX4_ZYMTI|nr:uncharacterized protein MYCGRDRAFT_95203 [Zymoseptoria tritici IPO323]EGP85027.1 hypothetical protein MYCGRDRAFT_95203 [Zymoseptoria tritici IPO323]SMQ53414.1 unnamed protein product [Zymoseptoria tritici ST99CH_3D7]SMR56994.1 unnamed protein product [Zymoseptoria tritici ST99CH_1E4]SMR59856.1 unnamed protein product [Zymoseptoria tritici ST99CH_3D1]